MQIGSIPPTDCGSFLHTLIFPYRGSSQHVERPRSLRRNRCKPLLPGQIAAPRSRQIIARLVTAIVPFVCPTGASTGLESTARAQPVVHSRTIDRFASLVAEASARFSIPASWIRCRDEDWHSLGGRLPCLLSRRAHRDGHSVCIRNAATRS